MAQVADVSVEQVLTFFAGSDFESRLECGVSTFEDVYEELVESIGKRPDPCRVQAAASDIFTLNADIIPVIARLSAANVRLGILSNTSQTHWDFISHNRYAILPDYFDVCALSFEIGAMKPDPKIYDVAADLAGVSPESVFFTDDLAENVEGARRYGFDAVQFQNALQIASALQSRGVRFNY